MAKILYLEPVGGIAGDMFLAAGLDLGVPLEDLSRILSGLSLPGWHFNVSRAERHAIAGTHVDVVLEDEHRSTGQQEPRHEHHHGHEHHTHNHPAHEHEHEHDEHEHQHKHGHRSLADIQVLIKAARTFSSAVKDRALAIFQVLGEAEAKVHGVPVSAVHFHEVGAVDSIVDICGAAVIWELLGEPTLYCSAPPLGSGFVRSAHGNLPVPPPATLEILRKVPVRFEGTGELTTPTGAALVKATMKVEAPPPLTVERIGYGIGTKDFKDRPNVLRASLGVASASKQGSGDDTFVLETNLDDATPQLLGELVERLMGLGVLDAYVLPATMKKGRPGHLLGVLVDGARREAALATMLAESTTLGVRFHQVERRTLERRFEAVQTRFGEVRIKVGLLNGNVLNAMPEFEDCRARAKEANVPVKQVWAEALAVHLTTPKFPGARGGD